MSVPGRLVSMAREKGAVNAVPALKNASACHTLLFSSRSGSALPALMR